MRGTYITAAIIALALVLWLASGLGGDDDQSSNATTIAQQNAERSARVEDKAPARVRAQLMQASLQPVELAIRGRTDSKRTVTVRAETTGRVIDRPIERGDRVSRGDLLCRLSVDDRSARISESKEAVNQAQLEYTGTVELSGRGLVSDTIVAQAKARLASAEAQLARANLDMAKTYVRAPFDGFVENIGMDIGDFAQTGTACADIVDLDPMLLVGRVQESLVGNIKPGVQANGVLANGQSISGQVSFIGQQSDQATRTYAIEVEVPNPDYAIRSGLTAEISVVLNNQLAHRISPSILSLNDAGEFGVKILDADNVVRFVPVEIVRESGSGMWVSGLPSIATVITVGQDFVVTGEQVEPVFEGDMPVASPGSDDNDTGSALSGAAVSKPLGAANAMSDAS
ncbi:MAG: efflux RND transporter periplasmic adaptor subunit [Pseudomonadaceae bacterium]|nr:efflux RND transporter periplasmic adaptor subunit [Pseudomonadaceae bacterium]